MKVLVINSGSSSLKYCLFDMTGGTALARGLVERIGEGDEGAFRYERPPAEISGAVAAPHHQAALAHMVEQLTHPDHGAVSSTGEIDTVGHRVVHGGEAFVQAVEITDEVIATVEAQSPLAPLHNPANLAGIRAARAIFPHVPHVAVFDTAFHQTMSPHAYLYAIPYEYYERDRVRRYGFHGTSHRSVARRGAELLGKPLDHFSGITCHLGNGCSMAAIRNGRSVDTSMGLTPLEGLIMGTRSGDIDPALIFFFMRHLGLSGDEVDALLNRRSGLAGISGVSNDCRTLTQASQAGHARATLALDMFAYRVKKYIGAYMAVLNGADAVIFTGGIGENAVDIRRSICADMDHLGIELDAERNAAALGVEAVISRPDSAVAVMVVPTNEELEIARAAARLSSVAHCC